MRKVHVVTWRPTPATLAELTKHDSKSAEIFARPITQRYYTKRAADKLEAELSATGMYSIERKTMLAGTIEDVFMHITGLCPAKVPA